MLEQDRKDDKLDEVLKELPKEKREVLISAFYAVARSYSSPLPPPEDLRDLNRVISDYFVQKADAELNRMWDDGTLDASSIESFRHLHERTPYNKTIL